MTYTNSNKENKLYSLKVFLYSTPVLLAFVLFYIAGDGLEMSDVIKQITELFLFTNITAFVFFIYFSLSLLFEKK